MSYNLPSIPLANSFHGSWYSGVDMRSKRSQQQQRSAASLQAQPMTTANSNSNSKKESKQDAEETAKLLPSRLHIQRHILDPATHRRVKIFVSSTFKDMAMEREALNKVIFPQLQRMCHERHIYFSFVDLRWGVTAEQTNEGKAVSVCLNAIDSARPYFLCVLGERYGWAHDEGKKHALYQRSLDYAKIQFPWVESYEDRSITELEILYGCLLNPDLAPRAQFYMRDKEHSALVDLTDDESGFKKAKLADLKARIEASGLPSRNYSTTRDFTQFVLADFQNYLDQDFAVASSVPLATVVSSAYNAGTPATTVSEEATAALKLAEAEVAHNKIWGQYNLSKECLLTDAEFEAEIWKSDVKEPSWGLESDSLAQEDPLYGNFEPDLAKFLRLQQQLTRSFMLLYGDHSASPYMESSKQLYFPYLDQFLAKTLPLAQETGQQEAVETEYLPVFTASASPNRCLLIESGSGMGKTGLLCSWLLSILGGDAVRSEELLLKEPRQLTIEDALNAEIDTSALLIIPHFVSASSSTQQHVVFMKRVIGALHAKYELSLDGNMSGDSAVLAGLMYADAAVVSDAFYQALYRASPILAQKGEKLVLLLDGADQLQTGQDLLWLPDTLPDNILLIVTVNPRDNVLDNFYATAHASAAHRLKIQLLSRPEQHVLVQSFLTQHSKTLSDAQLKVILGHANDASEDISTRPTDFSENPAAHPLFLVTLLNELVVTGKFEDLDNQIVNYLFANSIEELYDIIFERVEDDNSAEGVAYALSFLHCSRSGISEQELADLLDLAMGRVLSHHERAGIFAAIHSVVSDTGGLLRLKNAYARAAVASRYLADTVAVGPINLGYTKVRDVMVDYFGDKLTEAAADAERGSNDSSNEEDESGSESDSAYSDDASRGSFTGSSASSSEASAMEIKTQGKLSLAVLSQKTTAAIAAGEVEVGLAVLEKERALMELLHVLSSSDEARHEGQLYHYLTGKTTCLDIFVYFYDISRKHLLEQLWIRASQQDFNKKAVRVYMNAYDRLVAEEGVRPTEAALTARSALMEKIALFCQEHSFFQEALQLWKAKAELDRSLYGDLNAHAALCQFQLAVVKLELADYKGARKHANIAFELRKREYGESAMATLKVLELMATLEKKSGQYHRALTLYTGLLESLVEVCYSQNHPLVCKILLEKGDVHRKLGQWDDVELLYTQGVLSSKLHSGTNSVVYAECVRKMALIHKKRGDYAEALSILTPAMEILGQHYGFHHARYSEVLVQLADIYRKQSLLDNAKDYYKRALFIDREIFGAKSLRVAEILLSMALLSKKEGWYDSALETYDDSLKIHIAVLGKNHCKVANIYNLVGDIHRKQEKFDLALQYYNDAHVIYTAHFGKSHIEVGETLYNMSLVYKKRGEYKEAEQHCMEAVTVAERACGKNHPKVSLFLNHLADIHRKQGRYHYCKPEYERVIAIMRREHGSEYLELVDPMMGLAAVCKKLGEYSVCETLLNQCMKVVTQVFGAEHPKMALALQALGDVHRKQMEQVDKTKNVEKHTALRVKAKTMYLHSIEINKQAFNGQSNIEVAEALRSLSLIVEDTKQAVAHMREAMNIVTERLGPQHPKFAMLWNTLGDVLFKSGDEIGALQAYSFAYEGNCKLFKDRELGHPEIAHALFGKGRCAVASGSHAEAETHLLDSISMTEATLGPKSPNLRARVIALAKCYLAWGAHDTEAQQVLESVGIYDFAAIE